LSDAGREVGTQRRQSWKGMAALLIGATALGFSAIFVRWAEGGGATVLTVGLYRMLFALPGAFLLASRTGRLGAAAPGMRWALASGVAFFVDLALWHQAMSYTTVANATLLLGGLSPIWVALFSVAVLRRRYRWLGWLGQLVGLAGALILALARGARGGSGVGEAIAIVGSFFYAAFTLAMARSRRTLAAPQALFWMSLGCLSCFLIAALLAGHPLTGYSARAWISLGALSLVVQLFGWWLNSWGLGHVDAAAGALALQAQQVATLFLAAWFLAEPLRALGLAGGALLVCGIVFVTLGSTPAAAPTAPTAPAMTPAPAPAPATPTVP
jgi:drug/metabolite transporter (DMT)-like permease